MFKPVNPLPTGIIPENRNPLKAGRPAEDTCILPNRLAWSTPRWESRATTDGPATNVLKDLPGMATTDIVIRGAREHNLRDVVARPAARRADLLHRRQRLGQELAGVRHALRRGAAAVRREPLQLRPAVPRADAQARRRLDRRAVARRSRSSRRPAAGTRGRPSARSPRSTTTSASSSPGSARGTARSATGRSRRRPASRSSRRILALPDGHGVLASSPR